MKTSNELTHDEILVACRNIGINLECGGCAENFYTGFNNPLHHDTNCTKDIAKKNECERIREALLDLIKDSPASPPHLYRETAEEICPL